MKNTYRAMQVSRPGTLELVQRQMPEPAKGEVLIEVEACGICGADISDIENADPKLNPPRVPGHEVIGRILALGANTTSIWKIGQRVGIGRLGGPCGECDQCRRGQFALCQNQPFVGSSCDGGYAEIMLARASGLISIPEELESEQAAPILCAGIATFNALKKSGAQPGDTVAILGIGGLGHMALQYAQRMGFRVVAIGRGADIEQDALKLGAHIYIDTNNQNPTKLLKEMGGAQAVITTIGHSALVSELLMALAPQGRLILLGAGKEPLSVVAGQMVVGERSIFGSITGSPYENELALKFSTLVNATPWVETMPLEKANEAYLRMKSGDVKFRMVLTTSTKKDIK